MSKLNRLADRLVNRLAPRATASAGCGSDTTKCAEDLHGRCTTKRALYRRKCGEWTWYGCC
ncbi:hypothetical protein [Phytomonospora endophytica]|uniref:Uncharacterized protein n=1 Tax=Phytomonospora endophytica TaxID=714109 RepID=A0A841FWJ0_9ACTN|nr:hypothetical protein [Phytomonospora endophytica]MBB6036340.1 hypothetical protein [Phytomonospora endophytica]GIG67247.1 hypothetical protein Pen01_35420 [Phytomonospora endophytica]